MKRLITLSCYLFMFSFEIITCSHQTSNLLKQQQTVERSAGGGAVSKKARITSYRESQSKYISDTMDNILESFTKNGEIESKELDEGVIALCKRHSATVVEAALREYAQEKKERKIKYEELLRDGKKMMREDEDEEGLEFRNPSAFLTHMIGRIAEEGVGKSSKGSASGNTSMRIAISDSGGGRGRSDGGRGGRGDPRSGRGRDVRAGGGSKPSSILRRSGVNMTNSTRSGDRDGDGDGRRSTTMAQFFPSMSRGRGRGRGYM